MRRGDSSVTWHNVPQEADAAIHFQMKATNLKQQSSMLHGSGRVSPLHRTRQRLSTRLLRSAQLANTFLWLWLCLLMSYAGGSNPAQCWQWAEKGECRKNPGYMLTGCKAECERLEESRRDKHPECAEWAARGQCDSDSSRMRSQCYASCERALLDQLTPEACADVLASGGCSTPEGLRNCRDTCFESLKTNLTTDTEGNCWYWGTDGECVDNDEWMVKTCPRACRKLFSCRDDPESDECAAPFECPLTRDTRGDCIDRAMLGNCRASSLWHGNPFLRTCALSCHLLDPPSVSHTVTRPRVRTSAWVDHPSLLAPTARHAPSRCVYGKRTHSDFGKQFFFATRSLIDGKCHDTRIDQRWRRTAARCSPHLELSSPRLPSPPPLSSAAAEAVVALKPLVGDVPWDPSAVRVQTVWPSPRVRIIHNFVTPEEAEQLIELSSQHYHKSGTARAGSDDYRTSDSAMLPGNHPVVAALRHRIAFFSGYPEQALEPLQGLRYKPGQYYKPHHDFYNVCETWLPGNRHFTFLVYLNHVEEGGETAFPALNLTVPTTAYAALLFNNCLDNGEPDERTQHEGKPPVSGNKYAINGWMRSKYGGGRD